MNDDLNLTSNYFTSDIGLTNLMTSKLVSEDMDKEEIIKRLLENEDELMPILKKYLVGCLEKVMENPEEIIKDLIKEKDSTIEDLKKEVNDLKERLAHFENYFMMMNNLKYQQNSNPYTISSTGTDTSSWLSGFWAV